MGIDNYKKDLFDHAKKTLRDSDSVMSVEAGSRKVKWAYRKDNEMEHYADLSCFRVVKHSMYDNGWTEVWGEDAIDKGNIGTALVRFIEEGVVSNEEILRKYVKRMHGSFIEDGVIADSDEVLLVVVVPPRANGDRLQETIECFKERFHKILVIDEVTAMIAPKGANPSMLGATFGANTIDFNVLDYGIPVFQVTEEGEVPVAESTSEGAGDDVDRLIRDLIAKYYGIDVSTERTRQWKELYWDEILTQETEISTEIMDAQGRVHKVTFTEDIVRESLDPTVKVTHDAILRMLDKLKDDTRERVLENEIVFGGGLMGIRGIAQMVLAELRARGRNYKIAVEPNTEFASVRGGLLAGETFRDTITRKR